MFFDAQTYRRILKSGRLSGRSFRTLWECHWEYISFSHSPSLSLSLFFSLSLSLSLSLSRSRPVNQWRGMCTEDLGELVGVFRHRGMTPPSMMNPKL